MTSEVDITPEQLTEALERRLQHQELQRHIDDLLAIGTPAPLKHEPLPEIVYVAPPSRRYAVVNADGTVTNVTEWCGPDVCGRCSASLETESCGMCGHVQWQPPEGCRMVLATNAGNVGDRYDGSTFVRPENVAA